MEFRVLGPVEVVEDGRRLAIASGRQLALLALLLIHANEVLSADRIIEALWGDEPPETGAKSVAFHVSRLRDALEPGRARGSTDGLLATERSGYVLRVPPDTIDATGFIRLADEGHHLLPDDPEGARDRLVRALMSWRGEPYADVADEPFALAEIERLVELRVRALEDRLDADLALGRHADVLDELDRLVKDRPFDERAVAQLMLALYRSGRQAEALRAYGAARRALSDELGIEPGPELQRIEGWILRQDPQLEPPASRRRARNPYKGLRAFGEDDAGDFFGRERLVARLVERLGDVARAGGFLAVVGPSGSGKSSVVRAGVIPAVRRGAIPGSERWHIATMLPGARPFRELAAALAVLSAGGPAATQPDATTLEAEGDVERALSVASPEGAPVVLVIDQLEELYTLVDEAARTRFLDALVEALARPGRRLTVLATLRADLFDRPLALPRLGELIRMGTEIVTPLARDELERAIVRPAAAVGVELEPGLATEVMADVERQVGALPLLQYALTELFERSDGRRLTRQGYAAIGGVLGALGGRAEEAYATLDGEGREIARQVFLRLVAAGESGEAVGRRVSRRELEAIAGDAVRVNAVLDELGRRRLLSFDRDAVTGEPTVQVAHEALLSRWSRLAGWIDRAREDLWTRRRLSEAAADWVHAGRDRGFLLAGSRLELFASWAGSTDLRLEPSERELLDASLAERGRLEERAAAAAEHERVLERRARRRLQALVAVLLVVVLLATSLSVAVYAQGESSKEQADIATARELAAAAIGSLGTDPGLSLLLAVHAASATAQRGYVVEEAMDALHWALQTSHIAYPAGDAPTAVRTSPTGPRGVILLAPQRLMELAGRSTTRALTGGECRAYLHREACRSPIIPSATLEVRTAAGVVPVGGLATPSLAGTHVDAVSQMTVDLTPYAAPLKAAGIDVGWAAGTDGRLETRVAAGDLPDLAIVDRPVLVAELARRGSLVDLSAFVDAAGLRARTGDYLASLGRVAADGTWPSAEGRLVSAIVGLEHDGLVWYPKGSFAPAGYGIPRTLAQLDALADQMVADARVPWCLGAGEAEGVDGGRGALDLLEEMLLRSAGLAAFDRWASGQALVTDLDVADAFDQLGRIAFRSGHVLGGAASALRTPPRLAAWPMFTEPPGCWLHLGGATDPSTWPKGTGSSLAAFQFPPAAHGSAADVRARAFSVVVFHDRPEVRRLAALLLGDGVPASSAAALAASGVWLPGSDPAGIGDETARGLAVALRDASRSGTLRIAAADTMPTAVRSGVAGAMRDFLTWGESSVGIVLRAIQARWDASREGGG